MGIKIKKDVKPQLQKLPELKIRYTLAVPLVGLADVMTMGSFYMNPVTDGNLFLKVFFVVFGLVGIGFAAWGLLWRTTADGKKIQVRPVIGKTRTVPFSDLKKAVLHKRKKNGSLVYYELIDKNNASIVKLYPLMKESGALLERLKRLKYEIDEVSE